MTINKYLFVIMFSVITFFQSATIHAADFFGATVTDREVPTVAWRFGITGYRPIIGTVPMLSPARKYGLRRGNIILSVNGINIKSVSELPRFTSDKLSVHVFDGTEMKTVIIDRLAIETERAKRSAAEHKPVPPPPRIVPVERPDDSPPVEFNEEILYKRSMRSTLDKEKEPSDKNEQTPSQSR